MPLLGRTEFRYQQNDRRKQTLRRFIEKRINIFPLGRSGIHVCGVHTAPDHGSMAIKRKSPIMLALQAAYRRTRFAFTQNWGSAWCYVYYLHGHRIL